MKVVFSIIGTPPWANKAAGVNVAPTRMLDLQRFAAAAARRYSGSFAGPDGRNLPPVRHWLAWNEPNNPIFLKPQYRKVRGKFVMQGAIDYAKICNAIVRGIRTTTVGASKVACGVTGPRGNNNPSSARTSTSPLAFLRGMRKAGAKGFDAYAHHPYYGRRQETPSTPPPQGSRGQAPTAITLGNINLLVREPQGGWSDYMWSSAERGHTRPIVVLDEQAGRVHVFASGSGTNGGIIYHKSSSMANISFPPGLGTPVIASDNDPTINNVSSTKQSVNATTGLLIIAADDSTTDVYLHNLLNLN